MDNEAIDVQLRHWREKYDHDVMGVCWVTGEKVGKERCGCCPCQEEREREDDK